ncbi:MAG: integrase [Armatimonadota bacterium]|nr:MAG: integrase [Armatimonadota bacterium]GIV18258.1 MAG: integrase [Armatimonadota bacterium]GIV22203.1 MAG: integrase [Armatimonadota bacterium]
MNSNCAQELQRLKDIWLDYKRSQNLSPRSIEAYDKRVSWFIKYMDGFNLQSAEDIKPAHIVVYMQYLRELGWSSESVFDYCKDVRIWWRWLHKMELVNQDIMRKVELPKRVDVAKTALNDEQLHKLLDACDGKDWLSRRDRAIIATLVDTGLRASEFLTMTVADGKNGRFIVTGKGARQRMVVLSRDAQLEILRYLKSVPFPLEDGDKLWQGTKGPLTLYGLYQVVRAAGERAGVEVTPHALRRTCATSMLRAGASLEVVRVTLGHSGYSILQKYIRLSEEDIAEQHERYSPLQRLRRKRRR